MPSDNKEGRGVLGFIVELIVTVAIAIGVAFALRTFVFGVYVVPTGSMLDTIQKGDMLIGEKVTLHWQSPQVGDVVTFDSPTEPGTTLIKRVVAVGGQTIDLRDGKLYVDGVEQNEPYTEGKETASLSDYSGSAGITYPYTVPEGYIFCMGDNRTNSLDSRYFGPVSVDAVSSKGLFIYWPLSDARLL
ncbi:signal peptidase I [Paratractidigestivibacter sp.]|uniref:signal peptidase I n=1 Tax=Paratractidigestivibacter sp. TaxID=2847316 RepID=UPI002ABD33FB|nr:signal peptidase I [Paratractidigestivibacter sp.]